MKVQYKPETVNQFLQREANQDDEFQKLLHRCYENQRQMRVAVKFGYWFGAIGLAVAGFCYLVKINHWWGI